jgi:hypothetical protein
MEIYSRQQRFLMPLLRIAFIFATIVVAIVLTLPVRVNAQKYDLFWSKSYPNSARNTGGTLAELTYDGNGNFYVIAQLSDFGHPDWMGCFDEDGTLKWSKECRISINTQYQSIYTRSILLSLSKDSLLLIGSNNYYPTINKIRSNGDFLLNRPIITNIFGASATYAFNPAIENDGSIIMCVALYARDQNYNPLCQGLIQLSSNGDLIWEERNDTLSIVAIKIVENGNYLCFGKNKNNSICYLTKRTRDHHKIWEIKVEAGTPQSLYTGFSGKYSCLITNQDTVKFIMVDLQGNRIKSWRLNWETTGYFYPTSLQIHTIYADTSVFICGVKTVNGGGSIDGVIFSRLVAASGVSAPPCSSDNRPYIKYSDLEVINGQTIYAAACDGFYVTIGKYGINQRPRIVHPLRNSTVNIFEEFCYKDTLICIDTFPSEQITMNLLPGTPAGFSLEAKSNIVSWHPINESDSGNTVIQIEAVDRLRQKDTLSYIIHVTAIDDTPIISNLSAYRSTDRNNTVHIKAVVSDEEKEPLKFQWIRNSIDTLKSDSSSVSYATSPFCDRMDTIALVVTEPHYRISKSIIVPIYHRGDRDFSLKYNVNHTLTVDIPFQNGKPLYGLLRCYDLSGSQVFLRSMNDKIGSTGTITFNILKTPKKVYIINYSGIKYSKSFPIIFK